MSQAEITKYLKNCNEPKSAKEISKHTSCSRKNTNGSLKKMCEYGEIIREGNRSIGFKYRLNLDY